MSYNCWVATKERLPKTSMLALWLDTSSWDLPFSGDGEHFAAIVIQELCITLSIKMHIGSIQTH